MAKATRQIVHEVNSANQHRLIILKNGIPTKSKWFEGREVGVFENLYFHVGAAGGMPPVFRVTAIQAEVL